MAVLLDTYMVEIPRPRFVIPTIHTPFHIDFDWWKQHDGSWRVLLESCLCETHKELFSNSSENGWIDWIDPETAEIRRIDGVQQVLMEHCALEQDFISQHLPLSEGIFRCFVANGNQPLTPVKLAEIIGKPAETILKILSGVQVYRGIRPVHK